MKTGRSILRQKLFELGYSIDIINNIIEKLNFSVLDERIANTSEEEIEDKIFILKEYTEPNVEIIRTFLNIEEDYLQCEILEGDITPSSTESALKTRIPIADYALYKTCSVVAITSKGKIKIVEYKPSQKTMSMYNNMSYEQVYKKERDTITREYYEAFLNSKKIVLNERKVRDILIMLLSDFVIDEIAVCDLNPMIRNFDTDVKYAEGLASYSLRYINTRTNRLEIYEKDANIKIKSKNVKAGLITNNPYVKINELNGGIDFPLNTISYYWSVKNRNNHGEICIFVANKTAEVAMYSDVLNMSEKIDYVARDIIKRARNEAGAELNEEVIKNILRKLNCELISPSSEIIYNNLQVKSDTFEPLRYRYRIITEPEEFEELLYITIEDIVGRRYKYRFVENALDDLTTIGSKLEYTDEKGMLVKKQSIADFNVNAIAVIVKRETIIDDSCIDELLEYIHQETNYEGTESLPVPTIEVVIYVPRNTRALDAEAMYNGTRGSDTAYGEDKKQGFFENGGNESDTYYAINPDGGIAGSTTITVKYVNSKGEILKENKIRNIFPNSTFMPEIIPVINDKLGREWILENEKISSFVVNSDSSLNVVEIKYIEKYTRVYFSFINREGKKLGEDKTEIVQVGTNLDFSDKQYYKDANQDDWKFVSARPARLIANEDESKNRVILMYDIEREDVVIKYRSRQGKTIATDKVIQYSVDKVYKAEAEPYIVDADGLGWIYFNASDDSVFVKKEQRNEIVLLYDEAKQKVVTRVINEEGINLADEEVVFVQIGQKCSVTFEKLIYDYECKEWEYRNAVSDEIIVDYDETKNILEAIYIPKLSKVTVKFIKMDGRLIKDSIIEDVQVGSIYNFNSKNEVKDNFGRMWALVEAGKSIVVSEKANENMVTLMYEPLMVKVTVRYLNSESKELIPLKTVLVQAGSQYKNEPITRLTDNEGRRWIIDSSKIPVLNVGKHEEENIVSIYYDKDKTSVTLMFCDAYGNLLIEDKDVMWQIGDNYNPRNFNKITDMNGVKWVFERSEPKNLIVREQGNKFKLIYDELKAKIVIKHVDVKNEKIIVEDLITTARLGGIYVPNIRQKIIDKNKWEWKYIGDENINIITKENEQENIIILNYEENKSVITLKYKTKDDKKLKEDVQKNVQIGKEIRVDAIQKFNDSDGLGWAFVKSEIDSPIVRAEGNVITNIYEPLMSKVVAKFIDREGNVLAKEKIQEIQVGKTYSLEYDNIIVDEDGAKWVFGEATDNKIVVKDGENIIECKYDKLLAEVNVKYINEKGETILDIDPTKYQVGTVVEFDVAENYIDDSGKSWIYDSIDYEKLKVSEDVSKNLIRVSYKKELAEVRVDFFNMELQSIAQWQTMRAQIGSLFKPNVKKEIIDNKMLGWILKEDMVPEIKVSKNPKENIVNLSYEKYLVDVTVYYKDEKGVDIIEPKVTKKQVGTTFLPEVEEFFVDTKGLEWISLGKAENRLFGAKKIEPINVTTNLEANVIKLIYVPSIKKVTVRYIDSMGNEIKASDIYEAQIGLEYKPEIIKNILGSGDKKWTYNVNSKASLKVTNDEKKNIINLAYEAEKTVVTYVYKDEDNNVIKKSKTLMVQIGSAHRVEPDAVIEGDDGRVWEYKTTSREEMLVNEDDKKNVVDIIYIPLKVDVALKFTTINGTQIISDKIVKAQLGSEFKPDIDQRISDEESKQYKFVKCTPEKIKVKEMPIGSNKIINFFNLSYESLVAEVITTFIDIDGNKLKEDNIKIVPVGTVYEAKPIRFITDTKGIQWEIIDSKNSKLTVKEDSRHNQITMVYEVAKAEISIRYKDIEGNTIKETDLKYLEVGSEFVPNVDKELVDSKNRKWTYNRTDPIKLTVSSINNIINVIYQEKRAPITIKVQTADGRTLKDDVVLKAQVGAKYAPLPVVKVLYDNSGEIWRYGYNSPSDIIVSENPTENVIIQYFTAQNFANKSYEKKTYFNPEAQKFIDQELVEQAKKEDEERLKLEEEIKKEEALKAENKEKEFKFQDQYLQELEKVMKLTNDEKITINQLNDYNTEIVTYLREALRYEEALEEFGLAEKLGEVIRKEKSLVEEGLGKIIEEDRTGNKILKIFEAITKSEMGDKDFSYLQQRKAVLFADFFVNKTVATIEEVAYIINRATNRNSIKLVDEELKLPKAEKQQLIKYKVILIYESVMLDNYYRARSVAKDKYFDEDNNKEQMSTELIVAVANRLPNNVVNILAKHAKLSKLKRIELKATILLLNIQQKNTVIAKINSIPDGKERKIQLKLFKEMAGMK